MDDLDAGELKAPQASELTGKQLAEELVSRGLKPTGFPEDDVKMLQKAFNAEFEAEKETRIKEMREALARRRAEEEALRLQRLLEKQKREEEEAVAASPHLAFLIEQLRANATAPDMVVRDRPVGIRAFLKAAVAANNGSMRSLDLCGCALGDDVGVELGNLLKANKSLRRLDLDFNALGPKSLAAIAVGLAGNSTLRALSLEHNRLTGEAQYSAAALAAAANAAADTDSMSSSPSSASSAASSAPNYDPDLAGVAALAGVLRAGQNTTLASLNLFQTGLTAAGGHMLSNAVQHSPSLTSVLLSVADGLDPHDVAAISAKCAANAAARVQEAAAGKAARAEARRQAVAAEAAAKASAASEAEERWIAAERGARERVRADAEFEAYRKARLAVLERENQEKVRKERLKAEAEEKAKKAKKK